MSRGKKTKSVTQKSKNPLKKRLETIERVMGDGLDKVIGEINNLHHNDQIIASAMENHDNTIAAIRSLLVDKGILSDEEIDARAEEITGIRQQVMEEAAKQAEEEAAAKKAKEEAADEGRPDAELVLMHQKATEAGEDPGLPEGAFIFGG